MFLGRTGWQKSINTQYFVQKVAYFQSSFEDTGAANEKTIKSILLRIIRKLIQFIILTKLSLAKQKFDSITEQQNLERLF
jgi:hypothetical protein